MEVLEIKARKKKLYIISLVSLLALLVLIVWITNYNNMGFSIGDEKFRYVKENDQDRGDYVFKDKSNNLVIIDIEKLGNGEFSLADKYKLSYLDRTIYSDTYNLFEEGWQLKLSDGSIHKKDFASVVMRNQEESNNFDLQLISGIERVIRFKSVFKESFVVRHIGTLAIAVGLAGIIYSKEVWRFQHMFSVSGGEPTEFAIMMNVLVGFAMILFGLLMYPLSIG